MYLSLIVLTLFALVAVVCAETDFTGRYKLTTSENYNEFLKELGLGYFKRLAATAASSEYVITYDKENKTYTMKTIATFGDSNITFKDGETFTENRSDGETVQTTINIVGNKWDQLQKGTKDVRIVREFMDDGKIIVTTTVNGVTAVRKKKKKK